MPLVARQGAVVDLGKPARTAARTRRRAPDSRRATEGPEERCSVAAEPAPVRMPAPVMEQATGQQLRMALARVFLGRLPPGESRAGRRGPEGRGVGKAPSSAHVVGVPSFRAPPASASASARRAGLTAIEMLSCMRRLTS